MFLLFLVIVLLIMVLLMPTPTIPNAGANGLDDFDFPTADSSRAIPELYGTSWTFGNLIWYGNLKTIAHETCS